MYLIFVFAFFFRKTRRKCLRLKGKNNETCRTAQKYNNFNKKKISVMCINRNQHTDKETSYEKEDTLIEVKIVHSRTDYRLC